MANIRAYKLAEELGLDRNEFVDRAKALGVELKSAMASVNDAEALLLKVGFLYKHTSQARMSKIKALLQRAEIQPKEVSLIRGILRQMRWALGNRNS